LEAELDRVLSDLSEGLNRVVSREPSPSAGEQQREQVARVATALESLPADYRDVLVLRYFEGLALAEVAQQFGRSTESVRKLEARALVRLRGSLRSCHE
jgi:RNA polymerase sigma-70 factor (ECF subfamily)